MENDRKCDQLCTETTQTQNRKNKKIHSGPLQLVRKMIDMLLHVWVVCVLQMTVNYPMQKCDLVTIQRFLLISRSENHG